MFIDDKKNGQAFYVSPKNVILKGIFENDELKDNQGTMEYDNGDKYIG